MIAFKFDRARVAELLDCLNTGKPIRSERTSFDYLLLAGAALAAAASHGPQQRLKSANEEQEEAVAEGFGEALIAGAKFCSARTLEILDNEDELPEEFAGIVREVDGKMVIQIVGAE